MEDMVDKIPEAIAGGVAGAAGLFMDFKNADKYGKLWRIGIVFLAFIVVATVLNLIFG